MSGAFETFVQTELPLRPFVPTDGAQEDLAVRRGIGPRQLSFVTLGEGQVVGKVNGVLTGVTITSNPKHMVMDVPTSAPSTTWALQHNQNSFNCVVNVYVDNGDGTYSFMSPKSIKLVDANNIVITFSYAVAGKAI